jgi:hypothetical protein
MLDGNGGGGVWAIMLALLFLMRGGWGHEGERGGHHEGYGHREHLDHVETNANFSREHAHISHVQEQAAAMNMHSQTLGSLAGIKEGVTFNTFEAAKGFDHLRFQASQDTCAITTAIHEEGNRTRWEAYRLEMEERLRAKEERIHILETREMEDNIVGRLAGMFRESNERRDRRDEHDFRGCRFA